MKNRNLRCLEGNKRTVMLNLFQHLHLVKAEETLKKFQGDKGSRLEGKKNKIKVILNLIQDLRYLLLPLRKNNDLSGRFRIKYGMTFCNTAASGFTHPLAFPKAVIGNLHRFVNKQGGDPRQKHSGMTSLSGRFRIKYAMTSILREEGPGLRPSGAPLRSGFTLIELLVVVLIIGVLAAVAVPQYQKAVEKARIVKAIVAMQALITAEEAYFMENGVYADTKSELDVEIPDLPGWRLNLRGNNSAREDPQIYLLKEGTNLYLVYYVKTKQFACVTFPFELESTKLCSSLPTTKADCPPGQDQNGGYQCYYF